MRFSSLITVVDAHAEGNPERVVLSGVPVPPGASMLERAMHMRDQKDHVRTFLVHEPRGHGNMYAALVVPPCRPEADFGIIYMEPGGYATMCGHGTIAICTVLVETGMVAPTEPETRIVLDTPSGLVTASVTVREGRAESVTLRNVPSFLYRSDVGVDVPGLGHVIVDIAFGGNFFALLPAAQVGLEVQPEHAGRLIDVGTRIWLAVNEQVPVHHPDEPGIDCVNYVEFSAPPLDQRAHARNAVIVPPGGMDRSPCGTGSSAKMAALHAHGRLGLHEAFVHESIIGSLYYCELIEEAQVGPYPAVVPTLRGSAYIMGIHQLVLDPRDPYPRGFLLEKQEKLYGFSSASTAKVGELRDGSS